MDRMDLKTNPVIEENLFSGGNEFVTNEGIDYLPGNPLWEKYNGEYHKHKMGEICAGPHDMSRIEPNRILYPIEFKKILSSSTSKIIYDTPIYDKPYVEENNSIELPTPSVDPQTLNILDEFYNEIIGIPYVQDNIRNLYYKIGLL